jgi:hypothetical protein
MTLIECFNRNSRFHQWCIWTLGPEQHIRALKKNKTKFSVETDRPSDRRKTAIAARAHSGTEFARESMIVGRAMKKEKMRFWSLDVKPWGVVEFAGG